MFFREAAMINVIINPSITKYFLVTNFTKHGQKMPIYLFRNCGYILVRLLYHLNPMNSNIINVIQINSGVYRTIILLPMCLEVLAALCSV